MNQPAPLTCPFCGHQPGNLLMVKIFCANEECAIFDLPIDVEKWNRRPPIAPRVTDVE